MKYVDEFRDAELAKGLARAIHAAVQPGRRYGLMEFCGGHTHAIARYGVKSLLPEAVELIHGPGCPVCVLPIGRIDQAITLARDAVAILCTYADLMRVPASGATSLLKARSQGADIRMVYSARDAVALAQDNPGREVVFLAIGFETTTPPTAAALRQAAALGLRNFSVLCNHVLTPPAMRGILGPAPGDAATHLHGFIGPSHVSTVIGSDAYAFCATEYRRPVVIGGFEPLDVMQAVLQLVNQINSGLARVDNQFSRAVTPTGNAKALALMAEVFELRETFEWRGLGSLPNSGLRLRQAYASFDAERRFAVPYRPVADAKACECGAILRGEKKPVDCRVFGTVCTPENPIGSCMVSSEGACAAHYTYGRHTAQPLRFMPVAPVVQGTPEHGVAA